MAERSERRRHGAVLIVESDATHRVTLERACRAAGVSARSVGSIRDVERWPEGQIVITDTAHLSPWWRRVGAAEVIVLVNDAEEGIAALANGATRWLRMPSAPSTVAAMVRGLVAKN